MDNFKLSDFVMDFEFDFQNDFTAIENQVIDEILTNKIETDGMFDGMHENPSSFFEYFCNDSGVVNGLDTAEQFQQQQQQQQQMVSIENVLNQAGFDHTNISTASCEIGASTVDEQNVDGIDFDWTSFLEDKTPGQLIPANEQSTDTNDQQNAISQDKYIIQDIGSANVINDNGFIYQELHCLDVKKMYGTLKKTFGLDDLKKLDKCLDFSTLSTTKHPTQQDKTDDSNDADGIDDELIIDHRSGPLAKKKVFLMPLHMDPQSNEALQNVAAKLKEQPTVLNSILTKCGKSKDAENLVMTDEPKHTTQPSEQCLSTRERLERVAANNNIALPVIKTTSTERRQRKQIFKIENNKVPIQYAVQIILNDINKSGIFNSVSSMKTVTEKLSKVKKQMPKSKPTPKLEEPKKNRRSSKKIKIQ